MQQRSHGYSFHLCSFLDVAVQLFSLQSVTCSPDVKRDLEIVHFPQGACMAFCPGWVTDSHCLAAQAQPFSHGTFYCKLSCDTTELSDKLLLIRPVHLWPENCPVSPCTCSTTSCEHIKIVPLNRLCVSLCNAATARPT